MMKYNGTIYRPPVEAETLLLPITEGCTHNSCNFCSMYLGVKFRMILLDEVEGYLTYIKMYYGRYSQTVDRIYLVGADPFALSARNLEDRIRIIKSYLPGIKTVTMYAAVRNIKTKTDNELSRLHEIGINDLYVGVETGDSEVLKALNKGNTVEEALEQVIRLNKAGINHRDLLMTGTAGHGHGKERALATASLENELKPDMILLNTMSAFKDTQLDRDIKSGKFIPATEKELLEEEKTILENLRLPDTFFWASHPLDSVSIQGVIKDSRDRMLETLRRGIENSEHRTINRISRTGTL